MRSPLTFPCPWALAGLLLTGGEIAPQPALAATYTFTVDRLNGPLAGETFQGNFSFDETALIGIGAEDVPLDTLSFSFLGNPFDLADDPAASVGFLDGVLQGLDLIGPDFDILDDTFAYAISDGEGKGTVTYAIAPPQPPTDVPEPAALLGLLGVAVLGIKARS